MIGLWLLALLHLYIGWRVAPDLAGPLAAGVFVALLVAQALLIPAAIVGRRAGKRATADPGGWAGFAAKTSIVPFGAIAAGRNRLVWSEIGLWRVGVALAAWIVLLLVHGPVLGVSAIPF